MQSSLSQDEDKVCIVTEICLGGDLDHFLKVRFSVARLAHQWKFWLHVFRLHLSDNEVQMNIFSLTL